MIDPSTLTKLYYTIGEVAEIFGEGIWFRSTKEKQEGKPNVYPKGYCQF
jgi:hypothetical protein